MTNSLIIKKIQSDFMAEGRPDVRTGMEVEIYQKIKEGNKERIQRFKGVVIKIAGKSALEKTITVRRKVWAFGVEKIFTIHSPTIEKIVVLRKFKVRRKSIKFIRNLTGKAARLKEIRNTKPKKEAKETTKTETKAKVEKKATKKVVTTKKVETKK